jgi:WD40 repeat protein
LPDAPCRFQQREIHPKLNIEDQKLGGCLMKAMARIGLLGLCIACLPAGGQEIPAKDMPRMKGARLLVGYPPQTLMVTTGDDTVVLRPDFLTKTASSDENRVYPSISRDGNLLGVGRWRGGFPHRILSIATYSIKDAKWTIYKTGQFAGAVAISPDGSKLAFESEVTKAKEGYSHPIDFIDVQTGEQTPGPEIPIPPVTMGSSSRRPFQMFLSWSPDGKRIAYGNNTDIWVLDITTQQAKKIAEGSAPAWSPDGRWIAYFDSAQDSAHSNCSVVHPDGTGDRILAKLPRGWFVFGSRLFLEQPVWSPDSKRLLLNEMADGEAWTMHIDLLDVATGKLKRIMKNKVPVFAWAEAR